MGRFGEEHPYFRIVDDDQICIRTMGLPEAQGRRALPVINVKSLRGEWFWGFSIEAQRDYLANLCPRSCLGECKAPRGVDEGP